MGNGGGSGDVRGGRGQLDFNEMTSIAESASVGGKFTEKYDQRRAVPVPNLGSSLVRTPPSAAEVVPVRDCGAAHLRPGRNETAIGAERDSIRMLLNVEIRSETSVDL